MTIAACYLSPEGVILGADSATTFGDRHHFLHGQKIFEVGRENESTLGLALWGLGSLGDISYRSLIARISDEVVSNPGLPVKEVAERWRQVFWAAFTSQFQTIITRIKDLKAKDPRTAEEDEELENLIADYSGGSCLAGHSLPDRTSKAFVVLYAPDEDQPQPLEEIAVGEPQFWGQPSMLRRLGLGIDIQTYIDILNAKRPDGTPMWGGTYEDLAAIVVKNKLGQPSKHLPVREAIDWVYSSIYTTIKAMKFANLPPVCGGPIEIAVITADRNFRWIRHKEFDTAIGRHPSREG